MEPRIPNSTEWQALQTFLKETLRPKTNWQLSDEYPTAIAKDRLNNLRIIANENKILSHAALKTTMVKTPYHFFKVGLIGSVCTAPNARGKGLAASNVECILQEAQTQKCDLAMLWTGINSFYQKLGFIDAGRETIVHLPSSPITKSTTHHVVQNTNRIDGQILLSLFNKHLLRSVRTPSEVKKLLSIPNSTLWSLWNSSKTHMKAYAVVGKGADFKNFIHEWGVEVSHLTDLISEIQRSSNSQLSLITPPDCKNLLSQLLEKGCSTVENPLGMMKIINPEEFCRKIRKGARALGLAEFIFDFENGEYVFGINGETYKTDHGSDIVQLVFGPKRPKDIFSFSKKALDALDQLFPIPFWIWGWDSI